MSVDTFEKLLIDELKDLYSAETQITKALPKLVKAASSSDLQRAFEHHLKETEGQVKRLDQIFEILGENPKGKTCDGMKGVLSEGAHSLHETEEGDVRDMAMISAAQRVEHYEMAGYGSVRSYAERLGQTKVAQLLQETLNEEKNADKKLTEIAEKFNLHAKRAA
jgi:ferritin-like metal-binding protein YciE